MGRKGQRGRHNIEQKQWRKASYAVNGMVTIQYVASTIYKARHKSQVELQFFACLLITTCYHHWASVFCNDSEYESRSQEQPESRLGTDQHINTLPYQMVFKAFHETLNQSLSSQHGISADNAVFVCTQRKRADRKGEGDRNCPFAV